MHDRYTRVGTQSGVATSKHYNLAQVHNLQQLAFHSDGFKSNAAYYYRIRAAIKVL